MRTPIRWKLILSIGLPLLVIYLAVLAIAFTALRAEAYRTARERVEGIAQRNAALFDGRLRAIEQVTRSTAAFLSTTPRLPPEQLFEILRKNVRQSELIYGACIAFEPGTYDAEHHRFGPYVCLDPKAEGGLRAIDLSKAYTYDDGSWEWYALPKKLQSAVWTEPYFDEGAGNVIMCTFSVPFYRTEPGAKSQKFWGIATIDVRLEDLQRSIDMMGMEDAQFVITSRAGTFISHPDPSYIMSRTIFGEAERTNRPELADLGRHAAAGESGVLQMRGFPAGEPSFVFYAPIASAGWSFTAAVPEARVMAPVWQVLRRFSAVMLAGLAVLIGIVMFASVRITQPLRSLAGAVQGLGSGNLEAHVTGVNSHDEIGDLGNAFNRMVEDLRAHVAALTHEVEKRQSVESELKLAREIQASLLPRSFPPFPHRSEFDLHACNLSARHVAGDFFDFFFTDDNVLTILIADVSGKGVPAALFMAVTRTVLRNLAISGRSPAEILDEANKVLSRDNDRFLFVTIFVAHYETATGRLRYANAGHPPPYQVSMNSHSPSVRAVCEPTGTLLGIFEHERYAEGEFSLGVGERLLLYTDGIPEARTASDEFYGDARFHALIQRHADADADELCSAVAGDVSAFQDGELRDDVTILVLHRKE